MNQDEFLILLATKGATFFKEMNELCDAFVSQTPPKKKGNGHKSNVPKNSDIKDPDMPKKPTTAYILYFKERKEKFLAEYPTYGITDITKLIAKEWGELTKDQQIVNKTLELFGKVYYLAEDRSPFLRDAEKMKLDYIDKMKKYAVSHPEIRVPGQGAKGKNKNKAPLYQNLPVKKEEVEEGGNDDDEDDDDEENESLQANQNQLNKEPNSKVKGSATSTGLQKGKTKSPVLSDDDSKSAGNEDDSFEEAPVLKKMKKN